MKASCSFEEAFFNEFLKRDSHHSIRKEVERSQFFLGDPTIGKRFKKSKKDPPKNHINRREGFEILSMKGAVDESFLSKTRSTIPCMTPKRETKAIISAGRQRFNPWGKSQSRSSFIQEAACSGKSLATISAEVLIKRSI